jgi:hypothetical protein
MSYITSFTQQVTTDNNNSSVVPLNAGLSFVGLATSTLGIAGIQISMKGDENCSVHVEQSPGELAGYGTSVETSGTDLIGTGTKFLRDLRVGDQIWVGAQTVRVINGITTDTALTVSVAFDANASGLSFTQHYWDISDEFEYLTSLSNFGVTIQAVSAYLRVRITNTSTVNMTYLRFFTALCPIVEAVPRSLNEKGNLKTALYGIEDEYGFSVENTPMGEMRVAQPTLLVGASYEGNTIDSTYILSGASGAGASVTQLGQLILASGTASGAKAYAYTSRKARYVGGAANRYRSQRRTDAGTANNTRRWGIGVLANYSLTISSATVVAGDIYTNNSQQFTIMISGTVTTAYAFGTGNPGAGAQTYTRVSGVGPATLTGSTFASTYQITDGAWFQYDGTTFGVRVMAGGSLVAGGTINTGAFNGTYGLTYTPGIAIQAYEIYYTNSTINFVISDQILHTFTLGSGIWANTRTFRAFSDSENTGVATSVNMYSRSATIYRLGNLNTENTSRYLTLAGTYILKYGAGRLKNFTVGHTNLNAGLLTFYDGFSIAAPIIYSIMIPKNAALTPFTIPADVPFHNGLTVVLAQDEQITVVLE